MRLLLEHGVSRDSAITVICEMWSEQDLDEILSLPPEQAATIAKDILDLMENEQ